MPGFTLGMGLGLGESRAPFTRNPIAALFTTGVNGAWYDPSDFSTMFQDAAGTVPVTAVGQPVGRILDKSKGLVLGSKIVDSNFNTGADGWIAYTNSSYTSTIATPSGTLVVTTQVSAGSSGAKKLLTGLTPGIWYKATARIKKTTDPSANLAAASLRFVDGDAIIGWSAYFSTTSSSFVDATLYFSPTGTTGTIGLVSGGSATTVGTYVMEYDDVVVREIAGNHAFNPSGNSANFPVLQQDGTGRYYLAFNGVNQWLQTNSIDFTATDKMFVTAGVRHLSNANYGGLVGLGATVGTAGSFLLWMRSVAGAGGFEWYSNGNVTGAITESATPTLPRTSVVSAAGDLSLTGAANELKLRLNGSLATTTAIGDCGTGNYANTVITIGSYNASNFFNGRLYGLVVAGKAASANEIASTEAWLNQKTGAY